MPPRAEAAPEIISLGQEIDSAHFTAEDFERFNTRLQRETDLLARWIRAGRISDRRAYAGFELEAWLIDRNLEPAPVNVAFLKKMGEPLAAPELALFNIELNNPPKRLTGPALSLLERDVSAIWTWASGVAESLDAQLLSIGILPTLTPAHLSLRYMSPLKRYQALNEQLLRSRQGLPLQLNIVGKQHLREVHTNVMLESATTSFQIHLQTPIRRAHQSYNAAIVASAPMVAACANSPFLFDHELWNETRIPLFEQSVEIGGFDGVAYGPLRRVSFGSDYARESIMECFENNLAHFPVLLPMQFDDEESRFSHLRLHNGTIWRWNRPLVGFDEDGTPHIRIEHRVLPGSPSITDTVANAALFYGLCEALCMESDELCARLPFAQAKDNFYQAARHGWNAQITWFDGERFALRQLLLEVLLPEARQGLDRLGIDPNDSAHYLAIIRDRLESQQNGCQWQRRFVARHGRDMRALTAAYLECQRTGAPVHEWPA